MKLRKWMPLAAVVLGGPALAAEPAKLTMASTAKATSANQKLADAVAAKLSASGAMTGSDVSLTVTDGVVTLLGTCKDQAVKDRIINDVRTVSGVTKVKDGLSVGVVMAQGTQPMPTTLPQGNPPPAAMAPVPMGPVASPPMMAMPPSAGGPMIEPSPMGAMNNMGSAGANAPPLPPYAWPTYAPYNNVSRVGYPNAYPYNAYPFIGPYYPFPKVPLGWRKVTLEWEDGYWWYGRNQTPNDYWRVRFW